MGNGEKLRAHLLDFVHIATSIYTQTHLSIHTHALATMVYEQKTDFMSGFLFWAETSFCRKLHYYY